MGIPTFVPLTNISVPWSIEEIIFVVNRNAQETAIFDRRKVGRVEFERGVGAFIMAIDGTWRRNCMMKDVSETGAKLIVEGSINGLQIQEFFLLLSSNGLAYRRCTVVWIDGNRIGASFIKSPVTKKQSKISHTVLSCEQ